MTKFTERTPRAAYPGAGSQFRHSDAGMHDPDEIHNWGRVLTIFVYLDDVGEDNGSLDVWPGTQFTRTFHPYVLLRVLNLKIALLGTHTHYHFLDDAEKEMMISVPSVRAAVPQARNVLQNPDPCQWFLSPISVGQIYMNPHVVCSIPIPHSCFTFPTALTLLAYEKIYFSDPKLSWTSAVGIHNGRVLFAENSDESEKIRAVYVLVHVATYESTSGVRTAENKKPALTSTAMLNIV